MRAFRKSHEQTTTLVDQPITAADYDEVPYISHPYKHTHPEHLYVLGKMFGLAVKHPSECRVLELGCASGGNLIPIALNNPKSHCVGVDLSEVEIKHGQTAVEALKLNNIELKNMSITDIDKSLGKFDYIIVHGILSWVPKVVQDAIYKVCKQNLSAGGIAYISYNTLPGWNLIRSIREMMLYHTKDIQDKNQKVDQAVALLQFILKGVSEDNKAPYYEIIRNELETLKKHKRAYFLHDHLETVNEPFYFHQVNEQANQAGLKYLSDSDLATMYTGHLKDEVKEKFSQLRNDLIRTEQYMDFLSNRRFRMSLFCHAEEEVQRVIKPDVINDLKISSLVAPVLENVKTMDDLKAIDVNNDKTISFRNMRSTLTANDPFRKAFFIALQEQLRKPISVDDLAEIMMKKLNSTEKDKIVESIKALSLQLFLINFIDLTPAEAMYDYTVSEKPTVFRYARYQASIQDWVTNKRSEVVIVSPLDRVLMQYASGKYTVDKLVDKIIDDLKDNKLQLKQDDKQQQYDDSMHEMIANNVKQRLAFFGNAALLVG